MNIHDLKNEQQAKVDALLRDCNVFWAFSTEQFEEGYTNEEVWKIFYEELKKQTA